MHPFGLFLCVFDHLCFLLIVIFDAGGILALLQILSFGGVESAPGGAGYKFMFNPEWSILEGHCYHV